MNQENQNYKHHTSNTMGVLTGTLIGGLAGALTMLLLAPQSGKDTRTQIREKSIQLRDRTGEIVEDTLAQVRTGANKVTMNAKKHGKELAATQLDNVSEAAQAAKKAIEHS
jgi:gas vesicle protein